MARDKEYYCLIPDLNFLNNPFGSFFQLESRDHIYKRSLNLINSKSLDSRILDFSTIKSNLHLNADIPTIISSVQYENQYGKKLAYDVTSFYKTSKSYLELAMKSEYHSKPIFFYYGFMFLNTALINLFYRVSSKKETHGVSIVWPSTIKYDNTLLKENKINAFLDTMAIKLTPFGSFARIRDAYTILGYESIFSISITEKSIQKVNPDAIFTNSEIQLSLKEILEFQYSTYSGSPDIGSSEMLLDYLGLFALSSLARYRPTIWGQICTGLGELYPDILYLFERASYNLCFIHKLLVDKKIVIE